MTFLSLSNWLIPLSLEKDPSLPPNLLWENVDKWHSRRAEDSEIIEGYAWDPTTTRQASPASFISDLIYYGICLFEGTWIRKGWERYCNTRTSEAFVSACKGAVVFSWYAWWDEETAIPGPSFFLAVEEGDVMSVSGTDRARMLKLAGWVDRSYWDR